MTNPGNLWDELKYYKKLAQERLDTIDQLQHRIAVLHGYISFEDWNDLLDNHPEAEYWTIKNEN